MNILGVNFDAVTQKEAESVILHYAKKRESYIVFTPNSLISVRCYKDAELLRCVNSADLVIADGSGVISAAKRQKTPLAERVTGIDTAEAVMARLSEVGGSAFFLGGKDGVAKKAGECLKLKYPNLKIVGTHSGYFDNAEDVISEIARLSPDLLLVGMGFPLQEQFVLKNKERICVGVAMAVGGAFDVWSGNIKRAPRLMITARLEWFWRMLCSPRRFLQLGELIKYRFLTRRRLFCEKNNQ